MALDLDLATIAAPPARDETPARPGPAKESAAVLERASISWLLLWAAGNLGLQTIAVGERGGRHCFGSVHLDPVPCLL